MNGQTVPAAVLWDMDGTLVDSEKIWTVALDEIMDDFGAVMTDEVRESLIGSNLRRSMLILFEAAGREPDPDAVVATEEWLTDRMAELFGQGLPWRPGAREALVAVRSAGVPCALVTSTQRRLTEIALESIGREFFDVVVCGDEVDGRNKPDPWPYLLAARLLGVEPAECVAVEDSVAGVTAATAAGCVTLVVPAEAPVPPGERRVPRDSLIGVDAALLAGLLEPDPA